MFICYKILKGVGVLEMDKLFCFTLMWYVNVVRMTILLLKGENLVDLWYSKSEGEHICVGHGRCKRVDLTSINSSCELENILWWL